MLKRLKAIGLIVIILATSKTKSISNAAKTANSCW